MSDAGSNYPIDRDSSPTLSRIKMIKATELNALLYRLTPHQREQLKRHLGNDVGQMGDGELDDAIVICERALYHNRRRHESEGLPTDVQDPQ